MQFLQIDTTTKLSELSDRVGARNVSTLLSVNGLERKYDIGRSHNDICNSIVNNSNNIDWQRKSTLLNSLVSDSDIFEYAALQGESSWKVFSSLGTFPGMLRIPDSVELPDATDILGNGSSTPSNIYQSVMDQLSVSPHEIDPSVFNEFSSMKHSTIVSGNASSTNTNVFEMFNIPWGEITLYSSLSDDSVDFPVYPEEVSDGVQSNYTQMPDMLYQYEPWYVYESSGPRTNSYEFHMHRDMWTGNHTDGKCNELIRFCEAQCYAKYEGSAVDTPTVTLYVAGKPLISGIMADVKHNWSGPIGHDGWYLECTLTITITEVASSALNFDVVKSKGIIG